MPSTPWNELTLFDETDFSEEVGSANFLLPPGGDTSFYARNVKNGKEMIATYLLIELPPLFKAFVATDYYSGWSLTELDTILDKLSNPSVLKKAAIAATVLCMIDELSVKFKLGQERNLEMLLPLRDIWKEKYKLRIHQAMKLLKPDLSQDGQIDDSERAGNTQSWFRV